MKKMLLSVFMLGSLSFYGQKNIPVYLDTNRSIEERVDDALSKMTLDEKVKICHAQSKFSSAGVPRLGIPELWMTDGPHGIRADVLWDEWQTAHATNDSCIAFPALTCLAATWNLQMAALYGKSIGEEARYRKKDVLLGPGVNIYRIPLNGRNFEYMGEDPFLASQMVVPYVKAVQNNGVAACVKHFALNNQEKYRDRINVIVSERALHEIYLPAFKAAVQDGNAWAIMGAYNKYKEQHCCHNQYLLNDILKKDWNFDGVVITDWGGAHDTYAAAYNRLDIEMGTWTDGMSWNKSNAYNEYYLAQPFLEKLQSGEISENIINDKVRRILRLMFRTNMDMSKPFGSFGTQEHANAARQIAEEGIVLLKNQNNLLPINKSKIKKILVVGENAMKVMTIGGGSSSLKVKYEVSPLQGIISRIGEDINISYQRGYAGTTSGGQDGQSSGQDLAENRSADELISDACRAAKDVDMVVFVGGLNKHEGQDSEGDDRSTMDLPYNQDKLIESLAKVNKKLVVVLISGNAVSMPWANDVPAIVQGWFLGTESGNALASILMGDVNPSGKLPFTFPLKLEDNGAIALGGYPGDGENEQYNEDIFVGYRWHDKENIKPLFSFGHGLSYTQFEYGRVSIDKKVMTTDETIKVSIPIKNIGNRDGAEIVQLYITDKQSSLPRPIKELKDFEKIFLKAGEEKTADFTITKDQLQFYDDRRQDWIVESGDFDVLIGASSTDIKQKISFTLQ